LRCAVLFCSVSLLVQQRRGNPLKPDVIYAAAGHGILILSS
jgi:hypothetical protein